MVSEQGPVTTDHDLSLAFHVVIEEHVHDDVIMPLCACKCEFYVNPSAFS